MRYEARGVTHEALIMKRISHEALRFTYTQLRLIDITTHSITRFGWVFVGTIHTVHFACFVCLTLNTRLRYSMLIAVITIIVGAHTSDADCAESIKIHDPIEYSHIISNCDAKHLWMPNVIILLCLSTGSVH